MFATRQSVVRPLAAALAGLIALGALVAGGCSSAKPPAFRASDASVSRRDAGTLDVVVRVEGTNPREVALPLRRVEYTLTIDGSTVFTGERSPEVTLPGFGVGTFDLPATIDLSAHPQGGSAARYAVTGTVWYEEPGKVAEALRDYQLRVPRAPLSVSGELDLPR